MASQAYDEGSIPFTRSTALIGAALVAAVLWPGPCASSARGDDTRISLDHLFELADADDKTITSAAFPGEMAAHLFRIHALLESVPHGPQCDGRGARRDRAGGWVTYSRCLLLSILSATTARCSAISRPPSVSA
jgi:hypothetical protein